IRGLLDDAARRRALVEAANEIVGAYDWPVVAEQILRVYETVTVGAGPVREVRS
ncbi:MAG: alpha-(1-2)-phosphatidylinositol mannosyltransferase, partial [Rhodococcus sp. (in: high G+C Gram-positive bacteria)]|nr:alpha-(1-2)-phosphatidylinositol mannosyltransferase [Rhodococcus sp. (in: high G+C Gram-positive bacteria)]MDX5452600.1 alpha-(1-2)-phosphatidylinositol mannosyltransferase [Rhodococcus sp. (in: high G+C Gram-positive bacteria)]